MRIHALVSLVVASFAATLTGCVGATNPFDPETPAAQQEPAVVSGVLSDADGPVAGVVVVVVDDVAERSDTSDEAGAYRIEAIVPGKASFVTSDATHFEAARDLILVAGEERQLNITLQSSDAGGDGTGHITGIARKGAETNQEAALQDHSGITVEVNGAGLRTATNSGGTFDLFLLPGSYTLAFSARDHLPTSTANVVVTAGATTTLDALTLPINPGGATGTALLEGFEDDDTAHAGIIVSLADGSATTTTAADGSYVLPDLPAGTATLRFVAVADHDVVERVIVVEAGRQAAVDTVTLPRSRGDIAGTVDLVGRADESGALVTVTGEAVFALSAADGSFRLSGVSTGSREIVASADGFSRAVRSGIDVVARRTVDIGALALVAGGGDFDINGGAAFTNDRDVSVDIDSDDAVQMRVSEDPTFGDVAVPVAFAAQSTFTLSAGDGEKNIFVELIDQAGVVIDVLSANIVVDTTPPTGIAVSINNGAATANDADGRVSLTFAATDAGSGVATLQISFDAAFDDVTEPFEPFVAQKVVDLSPNTDGARGVFVRFKDAVGNVTAAIDAASDTILLDRLAPAATVSLNGGAALSTSPFAALTVTLAPGSEDAELMAVSTDAVVPTPVFAAFASTSTVLLLPGEGAQSIGVKLRDAAGNVGGPFTDSIIVDQTPPGAVTLNLDSGAAFTRDNVVTVAVGSDDAAAVVRISTDGVFDGSAAAESFGAAPATLTLPAGDGTKTVLAQLRDAAGNTSTVVSDTIELDGTAPVLGGAAVVINAADAFTRSVSVTVAFDVAGASEVAIATDGTVDSEAFAPFAPVSVALLPAGDCAAVGCKSVCAIFRDDAGNTTAQRCDTITLDTAVPSAPILEETASVLSSDAFTFHLNNEPDDTFFSHIEVLVEPLQPTFERLDSSNPSLPTSIPFVLNPATLVRPSGEAGITGSEDAVSDHVLRVRAVDLAGNVSPETSLVLRVDDVVPEQPQLAGLPRQSATLDVRCPGLIAAHMNADTVQVNFAQPAVASGDATFSHYEIQSQLIPTPTATSVLDGLLFTLVPNAMNVLSIVAVDEAGQRGAAAIACVEEDSEAPSEPFIAPDGGIVRADEVDIYLVVESEDQQGVGTTPVTRYEIKDGLGTGFKDAGNATGPFIAKLSRQSNSTEVCIRGVDIADNPGIEDCVVVENARFSEAVAPVDQPRQHDIFGDFVAYLSRADVAAVRDLRGSFEDVLLKNPLDPNDLRVGGPIRIEGRGSDLRVVFLVGGGKSAFVRVDARVFPPLVQPGVFVGDRPDVQANHVVYIGSDNASIRRRDPTPPPDANLLTPTLDANVADTGTLISAAGITLCADTGPRVFDNVIVWCQVEGGIGVVKRRIINVNGTVGASVIETLSTAPVAARRLSGLGLGQPGLNPVVISNLFIGWTEEIAGESRLRVFTGPTLPLAPQRFIDTGVRVDILTDMSNATAVGVNVVGLFDDVVAVDLLQPPLSAKLVTNDPPPQTGPAIDGSRVAFGDVGTGQRVLLLDRTDTRWAAATPELEFEPITSTAQTVWLGLSSDEVCLLSRKVGGSPTVTRVTKVDGTCDTPFFGGPTESDPLWATGGTRIAYLVPTSPPSANFILRVFDTANSARRDVTATASGTMTIDPDGDAVAWVDQVSGKVFKAALAPLTLAGVPVDLGNPGGPIPHVDIDNDLVLIQVGGDRDQRNDPGAVQCRDAADSSFRAVRVNGANLTAKGPKVARANVGGLDAGILFTFLAVSNGNRGDGQVCLGFTCAGNCTQPIAIGTGTGNDTHLRIARDGTIANITDELGGLRQAVIANVFTGSRIFLADDVDIERQGLDVAVGRAVWGDFQLGDRDVWELTFR